MKFGYEHVREMKEQLLAFMEKHGFETLDDFRGHSLQYFTTHAELVRMQRERKAAKTLDDGDWRGEDFVKQSSSHAR